MRRMAPSPAPSPSACTPAAPGWLDRTAPHGAPWAALSVLASDDLDETREQIARIYKPHELSVIGTRQRVRARMHHRALGPSVSLNRLAHGAAVRIDPDRLDDFFLVQMPLAGEAAVWHQNARHQCGAGQATVISPQDAVRMEWSGDCDQFMLRIDRQRLMHVAAAITGHEPAAALRLAPQLDLRLGSGAHWWQLMHYLSALLRPGGEHPSSGLHTAMLEDHVLAMLLRVAWSPATVSRAPASDSLPKLRQLEDHIEAHLDQPLTVADLARAIHSSVRLVQQLFARERGTTPLAHIRRLRLERVRHDLMHPGADTRVLQTAARWGFEHPGRFAAAYQQAYGESPSATLARSR
jgi:AraC-like DNA-binding protein